MRFTLMLSRGEHRHFQAIAQAAEASGWTSITIPDSLFFPRATESDYPYADTNNIREYISATPFIEPFVAMSRRNRSTRRHEGSARRASKRSRFLG
jgi:alkanesulfonate monooxygenase SsuD/methylene tetrahydromethanopterin reductase-like flavin-dependent oxidoreductase (luciferase family)